MVVTAKYNFSYWKLLALIFDKFPKVNRHIIKAVLIQKGPYNSCLTKIS
jgi:hypothetical protein